MTNLSPTSFLTLQTSLVNPQTEGFLSINASDPLKFDISAYRAQFLDPGTATVITEDYPAQTAVEIPITGTNRTFFVYADVDANLTFTDQEQSGSFFRTNIQLGIVTFNQLATTINTISSNTRASVKNALMFFTDHAVSIGPTNSAVGPRTVVTPSSGRNNIDLGAGEYLGHAINVRTDEDNPNIINTSAFTGGSKFVFQAWTVAGTSGGVTAALDIIAGIYDDGAAIPTDTLPQGTVGTNQWVNHRWFHIVDINFTGIQFGQQIYESKLAALIGLKTESFEILDGFKGAAVLGTGTMRGGSTDYSDPCDFTFAKGVGGRTDFV